MAERDGALVSVARGAGAVLLALGAVLVFIRRGTHHSWTDFELFLTLAVPAAVLFALAVAGRAAATRAPADPARAVLLVSSIVLLPLGLFQFLAWAGASTHHLLYDAAVLALTAAIAVAGARRAEAPYAILLAGISLLGAWMFVWLKVFPHASPATVRWLLLGGGVALLLAAGATALADGVGVGELATAGGVGAVVAGLQGIFVGAIDLALGVFESSGSNTITSSGRHMIAATTQHRPLLHLSGGQTPGWNIYLLVISVALVCGGARARLRGPAYVGAAGLLLFLISVGTELTRLEAGKGRTSSLLGWPLALVLLGVAGLLLPRLRRVALR